MARQGCLKVPRWINKSLFFKPNNRKKGQPSFLASSAQRTSSSRFQDDPDHRLPTKIRRTEHDRCFTEAGVG
jgi:hypothetical protein